MEGSRKAKSLIDRWTDSLTDLAKSAAGFDATKFSTGASEEFSDRVEPTICFTTPLWRSMQGRNFISGNRRMSQNTWYPHSACRILISMICFALCSLLPLAWKRRRKNAFKSQIFYRFSVIQQFFSHWWLMVTLLFTCLIFEGHF